MQNHAHKWLIIVTFVQQCFSVDIDTPQGQIRGLTQTARNGDTFAAFLGIPFGEAPIGSLRWQKPRPYLSWEGVRDGTIHGNECLQDDVHQPSIQTGDEDCLFLNVFTKHPGDLEAKKNVIVWIHGGAFIFGGAKIYNPEYIMEEDVVVVVIQYRLNIFGFLSTEDQNGPGNYGLWDQLEALRWVQRNIQHYGGDPSKVTLMGMSAGGASVHYHMLSKQSHNLFHNAISLSGSSMNWWAQIRHPKKYANKLASVVKCERGNSLEMLDCMRNIPAENLALLQKRFFLYKSDKAYREPMNVFSPRSDPEDLESSFLPLHSFQAMKEGHINQVPYLTGYTEKEGIWRGDLLLPEEKDSPIWADYVGEFSRVFPLSLGLFGNTTDRGNDIVEKIKRFYQLDNLREDHLTEDAIHNFIDVLSDSMFTYGIDITAKLHAERSEAPTYFYFLKYPLEHTLANFGSSGIALPIWEPLKLASHGTDMLLLFNMFPMFEPMSDRSEKVSRDFIKVILDFATHGRSTIHHDWKPLQVEKPNYLVFGEQFQVVQEELPFQERIRFWESLNVFWNYEFSTSNWRDEL
ncbi:hypothetical protein TCAL_13297 [Tigriopus californicus]|uniref:Carboxylesterase type B domain-containing protein n=1 Tax=Tigriopus californicus TaxID=6832 RepID=A0A553PF34_TIGCA|nr:venom carboxylesterase-6-like [Tigriopus californicus]TRY76290.1 hypothetical protein TCAL_13297 [Tigriopus californicus]|eukprot:TCALIF_13297-PA protein Name:"Similar to Venom carboxylesterase-6 (Apis mellifera)" AED:0.02 eAED:0.02 QI:54/1/1/1/1/1/3/385/573